MRIVVCVKQVYDPETVKISRSREEFDLRQATKMTNPGDRYALEVALRLREALGGEVIALSVGDPSAEDVLRDAVAMGADHGILVTPGEGNVQGGGAVAAAGAALERMGAADLVLTGALNPVDGTGAFASRLAAALGYPLVLDAVCIEPAAGGALQAVVTQSGQAYAVPLPVPSVAAIVPGPDRPRYPAAARIANAYKPALVDVWTADDLGVDPAAMEPDVEPGGLVLGPERTLGQTLSGGLDEAAAAAVEILRTKRIV